MERFENSDEGSERNISFIAVKESDVCTMSDSRVKRFPFLIFFSYITS